MHKVTEVGVLSLAKVMGLAGAFVGLLIGILYATVGGFVALAGLVSGGDGMGVAALGGVMAVVAVVGAPVVYGGLCFLSGLIYALVLNLVLRWTGGLEVRIEAT